MLSISNLNFYFGSRALYEGASLHIKPKTKIGLIGANGTGKSTLLRLISGEYTPDGGTISKSGDCTIGFLNQDLLSYQTDDSILNVAMQAFEKQLELQKDIDKVLHKMETNYEDKDIDVLAKLQEDFERLDGYTIQSRTEEILEGLGFSTSDLDRPLKLFSGGWRMRVMLAKLLLQKPALLLLDEPTNHLDLPSIEWVEKYIHDYEGSIVVVSHDRYFLDRTIDNIAEVSGAKITLYPGNYSFYMEEKALRNEIQKGAFENQQSQIRQTERFIERFKAKASKARQVQSRVKALDKIDIIDDVIDEKAKVNFKFNFGTEPGRFILFLEHISKAFGEKVILKNTSATINRGDKIALIGANGKGKSTLLRIISGTEQIEGERRTGHNVIESFFAQHQLESLTVENTLIDELKGTGTTKTDMELRSVLGCFLFSGEEVFKKIKVLSGGEKSRVALAKVLISEANFLLLDEPTNHLDMQSVNILIQALQQYEGTYVVVSHDRYFVSNIANKIWYIEDHEIKEYPGSFDEYETWMATRETSKPVSIKAALKAKPELAPVEAKTPNQAKQIEKLESEIMEIENRIAAIEVQMVDLANQADYAGLKQLEVSLAAEKENLSKTTASWEALI
ncbi:ABC-F family ATP-binding cassette domain-containing protein [Aquirufa antheringensis]|uniref:ABC transporter ATP-binding protein n=1 Tax=Aquirufa antheringensis TaxID=2516559 RepID=A0A4Q9BBW6_9BACT|nr:ABC-F family ATP-binding cassette domain-containing protein [Aquirufa antheringensis]MCL9968449.1 ABC-F family ATP-binding cassette domain-containing protein [Aquirufa antheringensis]MCZ2476704.1 ABC-F family ATP-binding cassette domain-containing protein [Aquirufa antheringensis]MCZ2486082.1 ABC-F family ATP-binding cassette domain-containing protein [Aquirufa antheringensis]TBH73141.1 ABC transporter ATP-binding protein [Aquirufa antheringensis]